MSCSDTMWYPPSIQKFLSLWDKIDNYHTTIQSKTLFLDGGVPLPNRHRHSFPPASSPKQHPTIKPPSFSSCSWIGSDPIPSSFDISLLNPYAPPPLLSSLCKNHQRFKKKNCFRGGFPIRIKKSIILQYPHAFSPLYLYAQSSCIFQNSRSIPWIPWDHSFSCPFSPFLFPTNLLIPIPITSFQDLWSSSTLQTSRPSSGIRERKLI